MVDLGKLAPLDPPTWTIQEGVGLVLPLHEQLIVFQNLGVLSELDLEIAAAYLRVATNSVDRALERKKALSG